MRNAVNEFLVAASVPRAGSHGEGTLKEAEAILGNEAVVRRFLAADTGVATSKGGPHGWDALTYLCFSRYLRLAPERSPGLVRTAEILIEAGADPNTGFFSGAHLPNPEFESALYGAAGVAHHAGVTRVLLEHGADPNDGEVAYHAPEGWDNRGGPSRRPSASRCRPTPCSWPRT